MQENMIRTWLLLLLSCLSFPLCAQQDSLQASVLQSDSLRLAPAPKPRPWLAFVESEGLNLGLLAFDHFVLKEDFAKVTLKTVRRNAKMGEWFWDSDYAYTNLFEHPYHGALYYNSARSNGLTFWQSAPFAVGGSLLWEIAGESELPSVNDFAATSFGGVAIGEVTHRLSSLVLNDRRRGFPRFLTELLAAAIDPPRGLNRVIRGDAWRIRRSHHLYHDFKRVPIDLNFSSGWRHVNTSGIKKSSMNTVFFDFSIRYGNAVPQRKERPYDYFMADARVVVGAHQNMLNRADIIGRLKGWQMSDSASTWQTGFGLYQFFGYHYTNSIHDGETPYILSEAASLGAGFTFCRRPGKGTSSPRIEAAVFASGIGLGGSLTDYSAADHTRNYNFGSGFSTKMLSLVEISRRVRLDVRAEYVRMFTWKSYEEAHYKPEIYKTSTQGDAGCTWMTVVTPVLGIRLSEHYWLSVAGDYLLRHTRYKYHPATESATRELRMALKYQL